MLRIVILFFAAFLMVSCSNRMTDTSVRDFGAVAGGKKNNSEFFQKAIDQCFKNGGGKVIVPAGEYFTGAFRLKSNVELYLESGAVLIASSLKEDYVVDGEQVTRLIVANDAENITLSGRGTILGTGATDGAVKRGVTTKMPDFRPGLIQFDHCNNVVIENIYLKNSDFFAITLHKCENILIHGINIRNNYFHPNSDGIDPGECKNLVISDCNIVSGDDCICFKNGAENVVINNCILSTPSTAIKFGTSTEKVFRDIVISNTVIYNSMVGLGIYMKDGGRVENVSFNNITIQDIQDTAIVNTGIIHQQLPIYIDIDKRNEDSPLGTVKNIRFTDISVNSYNSILIQGMKQQPLEDIYMNNIYFNVSQAFDFSGRKKPKGFADSKFLYHDDHRLTEFIRKESYITLANVDGAVLQNIFVNIPEEVYSSYPRNSLALYNVRTILRENIYRNIDAGGNKTEVIYGLHSHPAEGEILK